MTELMNLVDLIDAQLNVYNTFGYSGSAQMYTETEVWSEEVPCPDCGILDGICPTCNDTGYIFKELLETFDTLEISSTTFNTLKGE